MPEETLTQWAIRRIFWKGVAILCSMAVSGGVAWMIGMTFFQVYRDNPGSMWTVSIAAAVATGVGLAAMEYYKFVREKEALQRQRIEEYRNRPFPVSREMAEAMLVVRERMEQVSQDDSGARLYDHRPAAPYTGAAPGIMGGVGMAAGAMAGITGVPRVPERPHLVDITERDLANAPPTEDLVERIRADPRPISPEGKPKKRDRYEMIKV